MGHHRGMRPGRSPEFCATLKLLAASVVPRRNVPPSSRVSKQWPRSFGLRSDAPSRASSLSPARPRRSRATDHPTASSGGGALEDLFHLMVVIPIETANLLRFFRTLQLSAHKAVLRTVAGLNAQPAVSPFHFSTATTTKLAATFHQGLLRREGDEKTVQRRVGKPGVDNVSLVTERFIRTDTCGS